MNQSLVQAARELSERTHKGFTESLAILQAVWTDLTGQPVYTTTLTPAVAGDTREIISNDAYDSIDDFDL